MKQPLTLLLLLISCSYNGLYAQLNNQLCNVKQELLVFAFQLPNKKWCSVCKEKNEKYIVYRFGKMDKIELEYPAAPDSNSWKQFSFNGYNRGGGKENAAMNFAFLNFSNKGIVYEIYDTWNSEDDQSNCGITVRSNKNSVDRRGVLKSRNGYLLSLSNNDKIKREEQ